MFTTHEKVADPVVYAKYFHPFPSWTWYATAFNPGDGLFFGFVDGSESERDYFSVVELESITISGLGVERAVYDTPGPWSEVRPAPAGA